MLTAASLFGDHAGDFVCAIRDANSPLNDVLHLDLFLAARCLADDVPVEPQLQQELVNDVATLALRGDFKKLRDEAMMLIETLRGTGAMHQAERVLVAALRDEDWRVRESAAEALGRMRAASDAASSALLELLGDENARLRWRAASALGRLGQDSQAATDALLALAHSNDWKVRESVMIGLGQTGVTTGEVVGAVRTAVSDQDQWVRASANWALEQLRSSAETEAIATGQIARKHVGEIAELVTDLQDSDWRVRERAIMLLGEVGAGSGLVASGLVAVALQEDEDPRVRESAARALALIGVTSDEVIWGLLTTLWKADGEVRRAAATALGRLGHSSDLVASALIAALRDRDADLRTGAALAIGRLDFPTMKALSALRRRLRDPEAKVADAAFVALWQLVPKLFESKKGSRSTASDGDYPTR
ncbi:MAG: HEAT repeat domain-containing protein [Chloroflexi bacterium]|nr:HEAT repeat domain-containing protein [Chloroflexota bacterium]